MQWGKVGAVAKWSNHRLSKGTITSQCQSVAAWWNLPIFAKELGNLDLYVNSPDFQILVANSPKTFGQSADHNL